MLRKVYIRKQIVGLTINPLYHALICCLVKLVLSMRNVMSSLDSFLLDLPPMSSSSRPRRSGKWTVRLGSAGHVGDHRRGTVERADRAGVPFALGGAATSVTDGVWRIRAHAEGRTNGPLAGRTSRIRTEWTTDELCAEQLINASELVRPSAGRRTPKRDAGHLLTTAKDTGGVGGPTASRRCFLGGRADGQRCSYDDCGPLAARQRLRLRLSV